MALYVVPKRLAKNTEIFDGIGLKEVGVMSAFFGVGLAVFFLLMIFNLNFLIRLAIMIIITMIGFGLIYPLKYKENVILLSRRFLKYSKQQNIFFFYRGTGGFTPRKR